MKPAARRRNGLRQIFAAPLALAVISTVGLLSALTGEGWRDWLSWLTLGLPIAVIVWFWARRG